MLSRAIRHHASRRTRAKSLLLFSSSYPISGSNSLLDGFGIYTYKCPYNRYNSTSFLLPKDLSIAQERGQKQKYAHGHPRLNPSPGPSSSPETVQEHHHHHQQQHGYGINVDASRERDEDATRRRYAGLVNALKGDSSTSNTRTGAGTVTSGPGHGRVRLKPILVPPALSGGPYNVDDVPSFGPDYRPEETNVESAGSTKTRAPVAVEGSLSQRTLCVLGVSPNTPEDSIRSVFRTFGRIRALSLPSAPSSSSPPHHTSRTVQDEPEGESKTTYVTYYTSDSVTKALQKYATEPIFVRGKEVHLHRHVKGTYLPTGNTERDVLRRLKDLVDGVEGKEESGLEDAVDAVPSRKDALKNPFRILPFPRAAVPKPSSSNSPSPFVNEPGTLSRILQQPSPTTTTPTLIPRSQGYDAEPTTQVLPTHLVWDLSPTEAEAFVAKAISPFMRPSEPSRHLRIYGAPRQWSIGEMGIWLSECGTLTKITDGTQLPPSTLHPTLHSNQPQPHNSTNELS